MKALFVIDMQEEYVGVNNRYGYDSASLIDKVNSRILSVLSNNEIVVYIKNRKVLKSGSYVPELADGLQVLSSHIYCKDKASIFSNDEINGFIKDCGVDEIETIGVDGNCCVASTAYDAVNAGLKVISPCDYIGVKNKAKFIKTKEHLKNAGVIIVE